MGVLFAVRSAPNLLVGLVAGALTDQLDRRVFMRLTVCGMALVSWGLAWLGWVGYLAGLAGAPMALLCNGVGLIVLAGTLALCLPRLRRL